MIGESTFHATARLEDGRVSVKVTAVTPYGKRTASTSVEIEDEKVLARVSSAMEGAIKTVAEDVKRQAFGEAARAVTVALENGEAI